MKLPALTEREIREWISQPNVARLGTVNEDGSPRVTALWYLVETDGTITLNTYEDNPHVRNIRREPRVAVLIDSCEQPYYSVHYEGVAGVEHETVTADEIARLYERYMGSNDAAVAYGRQLTSAGKRVNIRFTPQRRHSIDFRKLG